MNALSVLVEAKNVLLDKGWGKEQFFNPDDGCYCSLGAVKEATGILKDGQYDYVGDVAVASSRQNLCYAAETILEDAGKEMGLGEIVNDGYGDRYVFDIVGFNDRETTEFEDVLAVFDKAIEMAGS